MEYITKRSINFVPNNFSVTSCIAEEYQHRYRKICHLPCTIEMEYYKRVPQNRISKSIPLKWEETQGKGKSFKPESHQAAEMGASLIVSRQACSRAPDWSTILMTKFGGAITSLDRISIMHLSTRSTASSSDMSLR